MYMKDKRKDKRKKNIFYKILSVVLLISSVLFLAFLFYIDLLPTKYAIILFIIISVFNVFNIVLVNLKKIKKKIKKVLSIFMILAILVMILASFYLGKTLGVLMNNGDSKYKLEHYSVMVLKNSKYDNIKDVKNEEVGYFSNSTGSEEATKRLLEEVKVDFKSYNASDNLVNDLLNSKVNVILIEDSIKNIMEEEIHQFKTLTKTIYTFTVKVNVESTLKEVDVTEKPFAIYISGIDTYGEISSVSRSDVNMVMVVNPKTNQILLVSIPRDYYVQLHGTTGTKDKLTHAGIYGIDMSIQTIEDLLELDINYYIKVNFTSVIDIVDALGGLDVYSEYTFISYSGYSFKKGMNKVNGEQALDFARTRKAFKDGDRQRGKNQQAVLEAIIRKATDKSIITKYNSLLNAVDEKYQTNMNMKKITALIKMQLKDMPSWNVTSYSLAGSDSKDYTYTYNQLLYVMKPDDNSVSEAISLIDKVLNGETLENSYENLGGSSNNVGKVKQNTNTTSTNKKPIIKEESVKTDTNQEKEFTNEKKEEPEISNNTEILPNPEKEENKNVLEPDSKEDSESVLDKDSNSNLEEEPDLGLENLIPSDEVS